eukprot:913201_1
MTHIQKAKHKRQNVHKVKFQVHGFEKRRTIRCVLDVSNITFVKPSDCHTRLEIFWLRMAAENDTDTQKKRLIRSTCAAMQTNVRNTSMYLAQMAATQSVNCNVY